MKKLTTFQELVYTVVKQIPMGEARSYSWVACAVKKPNAFRAVGTALKANPFPIVVPCHRVICSDGRLGDYRFGKSL